MFILTNNKNWQGRVKNGIRIKLTKKTKNKGKFQTDTNFFEIKERQSHQNHQLSIESIKWYNNYRIKTDYYIKNMWIMWIRP